jgi:hypothetical protein
VWTLWASPAWCAFHVNEVSKILAGYNGDASIQAVELKMLANGENLVAGISVRAYDGAGNLLVTLGTFSANLPTAQALAGRRILCATSSFAATFGITPDLVITPGIPAISGQVSFEGATCLVNAIPYGGISVFKNGTTAASPLPTGGATALVRVTDDATFPTCPLAEDAAARFVLTSGNPANPIVFMNNAGASVDVFSTVTEVEESSPPALLLRVYPNPIRGSARVEAPDHRPLTVHDVQGRLVRVLTCIDGCPQVTGPFRGAWDGTDERGQLVPSGVYFLRYAGSERVAHRRIVLLR